MDQEGAEAKVEQVIMLVKSGMRDAAGVLYDSDEHVRDLLVQRVADAWTWDRFCDQLESL